MTDHLNRKAIVIGGASGIGKATAEKILEGGGAVVLVSRQPEKLNHAAKDLSVKGAVFTLQSDIGHPDSLAILQACIDRDHADAWYLINAAGVFSPKPFLDHVHADYDVYSNLNRGTFFLTQTVARNMVRNGAGVIVNIGDVGPPGCLGYSFICLFDGEGWLARPDPASRDGTGAAQYSRERCFPRRG
jgi:short-subunit dehydrogenase